MKKTLLLLLTLGISYNLFAQNSTAVLFTENGERFQLVMNGVIQNTAPSTNVKLTDLNNANYKLKILFEDKNLGEVSKNLYLEPNAENTYNIKRNGSGEWVVRVQSITPFAEVVTTSVPSQNVVVYHSTPVPVSSTTTTTVTSSSPNDNVNINMGVNGMGFNMNVNGNTTGTSTTQTTTTYSTTTTSNNPNMMQPAPNTTVVVHEPAPVYVMPGYSGPVGCGYPMSQQEFGNIKNSINSKSFENTKFDIAKQVLSQRCMTADQVKDLMSVFSFEGTKLDFAKFAYGRTFDIGNYYMINDAFTFSSSISDLNDYINSYKR